MESHEGLISYIIVPALPKGALVEWHVVAQENHIQHTCMFLKSAKCRNNSNNDGDDDDNNNNDNNNLLPKYPFHGRNV